GVDGFARADEILPPARLVVGGAGGVGGVAGDVGVAGDGVADEDGIVAAVVELAVGFVGDGDGGQRAAFAQAMRAGQVQKADVPQRLGGAGVVGAGWEGVGGHGEVFFS